MALTDKIDKAFRLIVSRKPSEKETALLTAYYEKELKTLTKASVEKTLAVGEYPIPAASRQDETGRPDAGGNDHL